MVVWGGVRVVEEKVVVLDSEEGGPAYVLKPRSENWSWPGPGIRQRSMRPRQKMPSESHRTKRHVITTIPTSTLEKIML